MGHMGAHGVARRFDCSKGPQPSTPRRPAGHPAQSSGRPAEGAPAVALRAHRPRPAHGASYCCCCERAAAQVLTRALQRPPAAPPPLLRIVGVLRSRTARRRPRRSSLLALLLACSQEQRNDSGRLARGRQGGQERVGRGGRCAGVGGRGAHWAGARCWAGAVRLRGLWWGMGLGKTCSPAGWPT